MAARILVGFDLVQIARLLPPVPVEVLADVVERGLQGIGAHAEVGIRQATVYGVDIVFEPDTKALGNVSHYVMDRTLILGLISLRTGNRRHCHQGSNE